MFRLGISKKYSDYLVFAMDINTGFSSELGSYDEWRVNFASEITKFKYVPFRFGIGFGGNRGASLSLGTGLWLGKFHFDIGLAYKKGLTINSSKGLDFGMSLSIN